MTEPTKRPVTRPTKRPIPAPSRSADRAAAGGQRAMLVGIAALVALAGASLVGVGLVRQHDEAAAETVVPEPTAASSPMVGASEVFLEPTQSVGADAFVTATPATVDIVPVVFPADLSSGATDEIDAGADDDAGATEVIAGSEPGLYGGTKDNSRCNRLAIVEFLEANPDKGRAWASVQGIDPSEIRSFVNELTPVVLLHDTRVTNHGFQGGVANPIQSVLQAGTAVLVDAAGMPRTRCACGNPLKEPVPQTTVSYGGAAWSGFDQKEVQVVAPGPASSDLVLQDLDGGDPFTRPVGTTGGLDDAASAGEVAIRADLVVDGLGDADGQPVGGEVLLGTAAIAVTAAVDSAGVDPFTPVRDTPTEALVAIYSGDEVELVGRPALIVPSDEAIIAAEPERAVARSSLDDDGTRTGEAEAPGLASTPGLPTAVPPTATAVPATATAVPPTATVVPPTATVVPPTATVVPPTATAVPPTATAIPPTATAIPPTVTPTPEATPTPVPTPVPREERNLTALGSVSANTTFTGFSASMAVDGDVGTSWFSTGPGAGPAVFTWSGPRAELTQIAFTGNGSHSNPDFRFGFGFSSVTLEVLDGGNVVHSASGAGDGWLWSLDGVVGDAVRLTFTGHEDPACGGFAELTVRGIQ